MAKEGEHMCPPSLFSTGIQVQQALGSAAFQDLSPQPTERTAYKKRRESSSEQRQLEGQTRGPPFAALPMLVHDDNSKIVYAFRTRRDTVGNWEPFHPLKVKSQLGEIMSSAQDWYSATSITKQPKWTKTSSYLNENIFMMMKSKYISPGNEKLTSTAYIQWH
ncbi:hypothetical protein STEG23_003909 [Scotinomys teguina]